MSVVKNNKASILLIDQDGKSKKAINVSTHFMINWKNYIFGFVLAFLLLGLGIGYLIFKETSDYYSLKLDSVNELSEKEESQINAQLHELEKYVERIDAVLAVKGLGDLALKDDVTQAGPHEMLAFYTRKLKSLEQVLDGTPYGFPHDGNITSGFGNRVNPFSGAGSESHSGIDFKGQVGDPVHTTATGTITFAGVKGGYGNCVIVEHRNGVKTLYAHLSKINVRPNQRVKTGTQIGELGTTGRSTGPHLHYEVIENEQKVNPVKYMRL